MSSRTRTLQQLLDGVSDRADVDIAASGVRHTNALVTGRINRAIQKWLLLVAEAGDDTNLLTTRTATSTSTTRDAANWAPSQYIAQPSGCMLVRGIDVWSGNTPIAMLGIDDLERDDAQILNTWWTNGGYGMPVFYRLGGTNNAGSKLIQIFPWAEAVYTIDIRYIPALTDLSPTTDLATAIDFICGGEEWVELQAAMDTLRTDGLSGTPEFGSMRADAQMVKDQMQFTLGCRANVRKVDTRERRRMLKTVATGPWRLL